MMALVLALRPEGLFQRATAQKSDGHVSAHLRPRYSRLRRWRSLPPANQLVRLVATLAFAKGAVALGPVVLMRGGARQAQRGPHHLVTCCANATAAITSHTSR